MPPLKRAKEEIVAVMLVVLSSCHVKSAYLLTDKVNISYSQFKKYIELLQSSKLIEREAGGAWAVTEKGRQYLKAYEQLMHVLGKDAELKKAWQHFSEA